MSASAETLVYELRGQGVRLWRNGDHLRVEAPRKGMLTPGVVELLKQHKAEVLALLPGVSTAKAIDRPVVHFRLPCTAPRAWATAIGIPGGSVEALITDLRERWPDVEVRS